MPNTYRDILTTIQDQMRENQMEIDLEKQSDYLVDIYENATDNLALAIDRLFMVVTGDSIESSLMDVPQEMILSHLIDQMNFNDDPYSPEDGAREITSIIKSLDGFERQELDQALICATGWTLHSLVLKSDKKPTQDQDIDLRFG